MPIIVDSPSVLIDLLYSKLKEGLGEEFPVYPGFKKKIEFMLENIQTAINHPDNFTINEFFEIMNIYEKINYIKNNPKASSKEISFIQPQGTLDQITEEEPITLHAAVYGNQVGGKRKTYRRVNRRKSKKTLRRK